jgi:hypothetical protein
MSTAALASARRRRTTNETSPASQTVSNRTTQQEPPNYSKQAIPLPPPPQSLTPLQILQLHDNKLKDLEALFVELNSEEYIKNVVEEKINDLMRAKLSTFSNDLDKVKASSPTTNVNTDSYETKLQMLETTIQTNLTIQNVRFDEFKNGMQENFNTFKENTIKMIELLNIKETNISSTNVSMPNNNECTVEKLDILTKELNELKLLVIKNQTLALETSNSIINVKDEFQLNNQKMVQVIDKINMLSNKQCKCNAEQCDPTQMFLQSFMKNKLFGGAGNMDQCYDDDDNESGDNMNYIDINKKLHIDLNNEEVLLNDEEVILNDEEIIIDENQLQEILEINSMEEITINGDSLKQELVAEINAEDSNLEDTNEETTNEETTNEETTNEETTNEETTK